MITSRQEWDEWDPYQKWRQSPDCFLCLDNSRGECHTTPVLLKDIKVCSICDMLPPVKQP